MPHTPDAITRDRAGSASDATGHPQSSGVTVRDVDARWTRRRARATLIYAGVGVVIGFLTAVVILGMLTLGERMRAGYSICTFSAVVALVLLGVYRAAYGTCMNRPVAPLGVAIGLAAGCLLPFASGTPHLDAMVVSLPTFAAFGICALWGGRRGVRRSLGDPVRGVGTLCAHCGYDLSGTPEHTVCSECGGQYRFASMPP